MEHLRVIKNCFGIIWVPYLHHSLYFRFMLYQTAVIIGYLASVLLGISLMMNDDFKFRWINAFGCLFFIVYGFRINAFPIVLTNACKENNFLNGKGVKRIFYESVSSKAFKSF